MNSTFETCEVPSTFPISIDEPFLVMKPTPVSTPDFIPLLFLFLFFATYPFVRSAIKNQFREPEPEVEEDEEEAYFVPDVDHPDEINAMFGMFEDSDDEDEEEEALETIAHMFDDDEPLTFGEKVSLQLQPLVDFVTYYYTIVSSFLYALGVSLIHTEERVYSSISSFLTLVYIQFCCKVLFTAQFIHSSFHSIILSCLRADEKIWTLTARFLTSVYYWLRSFVVPGHTLHLVGIAVPEKQSASTYNLFENIEHDTLMSVSTPLRPWNTISDLKKFVRKLYKVDDAHQILVVFSHHILADDSKTLESELVGNNALLTLAICPNSESIVAPPEPEEPVREPTPEPTPEPVFVPTAFYESEPDSDVDNFDEVNAVLGMYDSDSDSEVEPVADVNELFGMFKYYESGPESEPEPTPEPKMPTPPPPVYPRMGFDVIMQEDNVLVHKMPCGHEMNHESLYHYAMSNFSDNNTTFLTCPHANPLTNQLCNARWQYKEIMDILQYKCDMNLDWEQHAKLELLASRNTVEDRCDVQKCPKCKTLYYKNHDQDKKPLEEINTVELVEENFKFHCVLCEEGKEEVTVSIPNPDKPVPPPFPEEKEEEDIDGAEVAAVFGMYESDEEDSDEEQEEALETISHMFDDDEPDFIDESRVKHANGFCFCCGEEWVDRHVCDSSFKKDLVEILANAEPKQIGSVKGVPSIRSCVNCCQLIFHTDACKHMNCKNCRTDFCFVCLKPTLKGNWQCGSHSDVCPIHPPQNMDTLPNTIMITKTAFKLYD